MSRFAINVLNEFAVAGAAAFLAFMAFGTGWHAALFGLLTYLIGIRTRVIEDAITGKS
jgi:hypothetical protein